MLAAVKKEVTIPVSMKLGIYFTNLLGMIDRLNATGADAVVLFNRFYEPDIDIENMKITAAQVLSAPSDIRKSLRWVGIITDKIHGMDVSASTGIHSSEAAIKQLLAGATTFQLCSTIYENGFDKVTTILEEISAWMKHKEFNTLDDFCGKLSYRSIEDPAIYERAQFMKYFSSSTKDVIV